MTILMILEFQKAQNSTFSAQSPPIRYFSVKIYIHSIKLIKHLLLIRNSLYLASQNIICNELCTFLYILVCSTTKI